MSTHTYPVLETQPIIAFAVSTDAIENATVTANMPSPELLSGKAEGLEDRTTPYCNDVALIKGAPAASGQFVRVGFTLPEPVDLSNEDFVGFAMGYTGTLGTAMGEDVTHRFYLSNDEQPASGLPATYSSTAVNVSGSKQNDQFFTIPRSLFTVDQSTGFDWDQPCRSILVDLRSIADPPATLECLFKFFCYGWRWKDGKVPLIITGDDAPISQLTEMRPKLQEYGMTASLGITSGLVNGADRLTDAQLRQLIEEGFELNNHFMTNTAADTIPKAEQEAELDGCRDYLESVNALSYADKFLTYVQGKFTSETIDILQARGYIGARTAANPQDYRWDTIGIFGPRGLTPFNLRAFNMQATGFSTAAAVLAEVDKCILYQHPALIYLHLLVNSATTGTEFELSEWETLVDGLATRNLISVKVGEFMASSPAALPMAGSQLMMNARTDNGSSRIFIDGGTTSKFSAWGTWDTATLTVQVSDNANDWTTAATFTASGETAYEVGAGKYVRATLSSVGASTSVSCRAIA